MKPKCRLCDTTTDALTRDGSDRETGEDIWVCWECINEERPYEKVKRELIAAYHDHKGRWLFKADAKERLKKAIQQASQWLEHGAMTYEEWVDLKTYLDPIEDYFCGRPLTDDHEITKRFNFALGWYGPDHWRIKAYLDQHSGRPGFIQAAKLLLANARTKVKVTNG